MTKDVLETHIQVDRNRQLALDDVERLIRNPDFVFDDGRPIHSARGKYYAVQLKANPYGNVKMKNLIAHLKRCRKLLLFEVSFVSTVLISKRLPPQAKLRWTRPGIVFR